ncbi:MAG: helix-turn-helix domain-containing protein [Candidatus Merdivicinus sp.]|jgi:AraC family L-rhamnose operon regulatory protein RhaS
MKQYDLQKVSRPDFGDFHIEYGRVNGNFEVHTHDFCEIFLVLSGTGLHISGDAEYPLQKGELFAVKGSERHGFRECQQLRILNIMFRVSSLPVAQCRELPGFWVLFLHEQQFGSISHVVLQDGAFAKVLCWCEDMIAEYQQAGEGSAAMCHALLTQLVIFLSRACEGVPGNLEQPDYRLAKALVYLETHYRENIGLKQLAGMVGFSSRHFTRLFRQLYHKSPMQYLAEVRLGHACRMLAQSDASIAAIAEQCGFPDSNYFSRVFKNYTGVSPLHWKRPIK